LRRSAALTALALSLFLLTPALGAAADFLGKWGTSGTGDGQFQTVGGIATDRNGHVYAADSRGRIEKFTTTGGFVRSIGTPPSPVEKIDEIQSPEGVAVGPNGNLYVVESSSRTRVSVWSRTGRFMTSFADRGTSDGQLSMPGQIAIDAGGSIYVADAGNHRIQKFSADGRYVASIGRGEGLFVSPDKLSTPRGVAIAPDGSIYASDELYRRVQHYAADGRFLGSFGQLGSAPGQFQAPVGVAVAGDGSVWVADRSLSTVQRFSASGRPLETLGRPGSGDGAFSHPTYLALDCKGSLYVADVDNHRVQRFGDRGAASCGNAAADPSERLALRVTAAARQHFAREFAIVLSAACSRTCSLVVTGRIAVPGGGSIAIRTTRASLTQTAKRMAVTPPDAGIDRLLNRLRGGRTATARLVLTARDRGGAVTKVTRVVKLVT
jgi:DNA-binding beta-propeller fold protein YncE